MALVLWTIAGALSAGCSVALVLWTIAGALSTGCSVALVLWTIAGALGASCSAAFALRTTAGAAALRAGAPVCANDGWEVVSSAAVVDCTVRVDVEEESDVGHKRPIETTAMIVAAATATSAMTYETPSMGSHSRGNGSNDGRGG